MFTNNLDNKCKNNIILKHKYTLIHNTHPNLFYENRRGIGNNINGRGHSNRMGGPSGAHRGVSRGYGPQTQTHDYYDPASEQRGSGGPASSRLVNNALNVASSSNIPSNSGRFLLTIFIFY